MREWNEERGKSTDWTMDRSGFGGLCGGLDDTGTTHDTGCKSYVGLRLDQIGGMMIVSSATLREEHLAPAFLDALESLDETKYNEVVETLEDWGYTLDDVYDEDSKLYGTYPDYNDDASFLVNEVLYDALNDIAPDGTWFGAHEGDGALFGFWAVPCKYHDWLHDDCKGCQDNMRKAAHF